MLPCRSMVDGCSSPSEPTRPMKYTMSNRGWYENRTYDNDDDGM